LIEVEKFSTPPSSLGRISQGVIFVCKTTISGRKTAHDWLTGRTSAWVLEVLTRYESGKTKPPLALVNLLKVLERHPELLGDMKASQWRHSIIQPSEARLSFYPSGEQVSLRRDLTFNLDHEYCPNCGGEIKKIAAI
jgi:Antitoxin component of bacterial toxin-antitoxin system, MqsA